MAMTRTVKWLIVMLFVSSPISGRAESCRLFLAPPHRGDISSYTITMVTMDQNHIAGYASDFMQYVLDPIPIRSARRTGRWVSTGWNQPDGYTAELFSSQTLDNQPFYIKAPRPIKISITPKDSPIVTIGQPSIEGIVSFSFEATCSPNGMIHGETSTTSYILYLKKGCVGGCGI
jgi:hypothetical protein